MEQCDIEVSMRDSTDKHVERVNKRDVMMTKHHIKLTKTDLHVLTPARCNEC